MSEPLLSWYDFADTRTSDSPRPFGCEKKNSACCWVISAAQKTAAAPNPEMVWCFSAQVTTTSPAADSTACETLATDSLPSSERFASARARNTKQRKPQNWAQVSPYAAFPALAIEDLSSTSSRRRSFSSKRSGRGTSAPTSEPVGPAYHGCACAKREKVPPC